MSRPAYAIDLILDAAERLVSDHGAGALTFEALSEASGVTRGGITYHFPTKDLLLRALVGRDQTRWDATICAARADLGDCPSARLVGYIRAGTDDNVERRRFVSGMLSAVAIKPELLDGCRALYRAELPAGAPSRWSERDLDHVLLMLAADGLFWMEQLGFLALPKPARRRLVERLESTALASVRPDAKRKSPPDAARRTRAETPSSPQSARTRVRR